MNAKDWIKVEDRLPDRIEGLNVTMNVLVYHKGCLSMAWYSYKQGEKCWCNTMGWRISEVTHWMPIVFPKED